MTAKNGQVPGSQLVSVGVCKLRWDAAHALKEAQAAAMEDGVGLAPINKYSGYRDLAVQADMHAHPTDPKFDNKPGVSVAVAGSSTHGFGTAVDIISGFAWMLEHGHRYGFSRSIPGDTYHFQHDGKTAIGTNPASVGKVTPALPPEDDMANVIKTDPKGNFYRLGESTVVKLTQQEASDFKAANHGVAAPVVSGAAANRMFAVIDRVADASNKALIAQFIAAESD